ncbi:MAG TPA: hypothetical protein PLV25_00685, partial [Opitutales bacterium]|nr:hypothetical protein [Opitutales bacterium]
AFLGACTFLIITGFVVRVYVPTDRFTYKAISSWISYLPDNQSESGSSGASVPNYNLLDDSFLFLPNVYNASIKQGVFESVSLECGGGGNAQPLYEQFVIASFTALLGRLEPSAVFLAELSDTFQAGASARAWSEFGAISKDADSRPYMPTSIVWTAFGEGQKCRNTLMVEGLVISQPSQWLQFERPMRAQLPLFFHSGALDDQHSQLVRRVLETRPEQPPLPRGYYKIELSP